MSSESHDPKDDAPESAPPASRPSTRISSRAPSAWGAARDALAAVHNLEALLRSGRVSSRTIRDLIPELRAGAGVLREAFEEAREADDDATVAVGEHGGVRVEELEVLLDAAESSAEDRGELAERAHTLEEELEASADLLAVLDRAAAPSSTEVSVDLVVRETGRLWGSGRGREVSVRFDAPTPDGLVMVDPYVVGPLLALLVAWVHAAGATLIVVRARCAETEATFLVEPAEPGDAAKQVLAMRVMPCVPPTERVAQRVAEQIGVSLTWGEMRASITLPIAAG
jgi:hypothetical protein